MENREIMISVVVPVYKIREDLLRGCLESLLRQDCNEAEFLIIDDGSPDDCGTICDEYEKKDTRMRVFHTENKGVSHARNVGIKNAKGKYITFLDGDDCLEDEVCKKSIIQMNISGLDLIEFMFCSNRTEHRYDEELVKLSSSQVRRFRETVISHVEDYDGFLSGSSCGKVYILDIIKKYHLLFVEGLKKCQDRVFLFDYLSVIETIGLYYYPGYRYVYNASSITNRYNPNIEYILDEALDAFRTRIQKIDEANHLWTAFYTMGVRFFCVILLLNIVNQGNNESMLIKRKKIKDLAQKDTYRSAIKNCRLSEVGKKNAIITILLKLRLYFFVELVSKVIL